MSDKEAGASLGAQLVAAVLGLGVMKGDADHRSRVHKEAEEMNEALRELEARKMNQTTSSLMGRKMAAAELETLRMVKSAAAAAEVGMDKEAIGALLARGAAALGKGLSGASKVVKGRLGASSVGGAAKSKPLIGMGTKAKVLGGAALLGGGYATAKTLQAGRDYMTQPSSPRNWGTGIPLKHGINQYGYPDY